MKSKVFDNLKNADDDIIEELIPFSSDNEQTKKRVFEMSEKKYMEMMENNIGEDNETTVSGVEIYKRPLWYKPLCAAAAFAVIIGGIGAVGYLNRGAFGRSGPAAQAESEIESETTEAVTETSTEIPTEAATEASGLLSEEEMKAIFDEYLPVYMETVNFNAADVIDTNAETVGFWLYGGDDPEGVFDQSLWPDTKKEGTVLYDYVKYYKLSDERFSNIDELRSYYDKYFGYDSLGIDKYYLPMADLSDHKEGDKITDSSSLMQHFDVIGYNGALYAPVCMEESYHPEEWTDILSDRSYFAEEDKFIWERTYKLEEEYGTVAESIDLEFIKGDDGRWRISNQAFGSLRYDPAEDYSKAEKPFMYWLYADTYDNAEEQEMILDN